MRDETKRENGTAILLKRYMWLVDLIHRHPCTFAEIAARWQSSELNDKKEELPLRTFSNHLQAVQEMFGIVILCNRSTNKYYIEDAEQLKSGCAQKWLLGAFAVNNMLNESRALRESIQTEAVCHWV